MADWDDELTWLVAERGDALVGYAYTLCADRREAEDLVQEALVRSFARWRRPSGRAGERVEVDTSGVRDVEAYVRRTVLRIYVDGYRRRRLWRAVRHVVATSDEVRNPATGATARADVAAALVRLTPRQRACVVLRFYEDLTVPQVAQELGLAPGTVKRHLFEASGVLRGVLGEVEIGDAARRARSAAAAPPPRAGTSRQDAARHDTARRRPLGAFPVGEAL